MSGERPVKPASLDTPGLIFRARQSGWLLMWSPRSDLVERGYPKTTYRLWPPSAVSPHPTEPTAEEWEGISAWCMRYQAEMLLWANGGAANGPTSVFDGTIKSLSKLYQTDPDSPFQNLRHETKQRYGYSLNALEKTVGDRRIADLTFRDFKRWYQEFAAPDAPGGSEMLSRAYHLITTLRLLFAFGKLALPKASGCADVVEILSAMEFRGGKGQRQEILTYQQATLICNEAQRRRLSSIALAQAMQTECGLRQKDLIGEWVPRSATGVTDIFWGPSKWLMGARWEEVDENFIWRHRLSKSVKGNQAIMNADLGKVEEYDLRAFPLVVAQLQRIGAVVDLRRADFPASGPMIICERTGRPWWDTKFRTRWRQIARACGIPDAIQNRDSRPGAATEAEFAGARKETVQRLLGHSRAETTEIYLRGGREIRSEIAKLRAEKRKR
jgi:Phage integrase family